MDVMQVLQSGAALVFVLALIALASLYLRRFGEGGMASKSEGGHKRLSIQEIKMLDAKRKLVLVRRDKVEHLLLLTPDRETVIESGIEVDER